jgi:hypothetical protein
MQDLIKQAFVGVDVVGPEVQAGRYDVTGPNGQVILPQAWERTVEPGWRVGIVMWPLEESLPRREPRAVHSLPSRKRVVRPPAKGRRHPKPLPEWKW